MPGASAAVGVSCIYRGYVLHGKCPTIHMTSIVDWDKLENFNFRINTGAYQSVQGTSSQSDQLLCCLKFWSP